MLKIKVDEYPGNLSITIERGDEIEIVNKSTEGLSYDDIIDIRYELNNCMSIDELKKIDSEYYLGINDIFNS